MRKEYDFSKGKKGKFYHSDMQLNIPVPPPTAQLLLGLFKSCSGQWACTKKTAVRGYIFMDG